MLNLLKAAGKPTHDRASIGLAALSHAEQLIQEANTSSSQPTVPEAVTLKPFPLLWYACVAVAKPQDRQRVRTVWVQFVTTLPPAMASLTQPTFARPCRLLETDEEPSEELGDAVEGAEGELDA